MMMMFFVKNPPNVFITRHSHLHWWHKQLWKVQHDYPLLLRPHSHWFCLGVCGWGWGRWRGRRLKCGRSAATHSSGQAGRGCIGQSHLTEWRTWISSEMSGTGTGGTVDTERSLTWSVRESLTWVGFSLQWTVKVNFKMF